MAHRITTRTRLLAAFLVALTLLGAGGVLISLPDPSASQTDPARIQAVPVAAGIVDPSGVVWGWGDASSGQLGNDLVGWPSLVSSSRQVAGLDGITAIAAGSYHTLALVSDATVWSWGGDADGQLGDGMAGDPDSRATPQQIAGLSGVRGIAAGKAHSLAVKTDGTVWAWGDDAEGQLGDGNSGTGTGTPQQVPGLSGIVAVAGGDGHSLALAGNGTVWAWGGDADGQLGDGTPGAGAASPQQVTGLSAVKAVAAGRAHSLVVKTDGTVWTWGDDTEGQLGDGTAGPGAAAPQQVPGLANIALVAAGTAHSLAARADGLVWAWGWDLYGQVGDGTLGSPDQQASPQQVAGLDGVVAIAGGESHSLAARTDGTVWAWGEYGFGQLGDGIEDSPGGRPAPRAVSGVSQVGAVAAGGDSSLALGSGTIILPSPSPSPATSPNPSPGSSPLASPSTQVTLRVPVSGNGAVQRAAPGTASGPDAFLYPTGTAVTLTPQPQSGSAFVGWRVDGIDAGWAASLTITMDNNRTVEARFVAAVTFPDVPGNRADAAAIVALASRGTIRGYGNGNYGPDDGMQRAQMAALIARATPLGPDTPPTTLAPPACLAVGTWDCEDWGNNFSDRNGLDANLWRNVGALQHYRVAFGYDGAACASRGVPSPCYAPGAPVSYVETVTFITRAMVAKGYWQIQSGAPQPYGGVPGVFAAEVATFHFYTGGVPAPPSDWNAGATRGWFARALWAALDTYWGRDGALPDGRNGGGSAR